MSINQKPVVMDAIVIVTEQSLESVKTTLSSILGEIAVYTTTKQRIETDVGKYLTNEEVARKLGVTTRTIANYRKEKLLPYILIGGKSCYYEEDVEIFIKKYNKHI